MTTCTHCWHSTGLALLSSPLQFPQICCHCGEKRVISDPATSTNGHGPFVPGRDFESLSIAISKAPPRNSPERDQMMNDIAEESTRRYSMTLKKLAQEYGVTEYAILQEVTNYPQKTEREAAEYLSQKRQNRLPFWRRLFK